MPLEDLVVQVRFHTIDPLRLTLYRRVFLIAIVGNGLLAVSKGVVAYLSGSNAVLADAANSFSDVLYTLFLVVGLWLSQKPADPSHPQGHARFEPLVSLVIAATMALTGYEVMRHSFMAVLGQPQAIDPGWPTVVLVGSGVIKAGMFWLVRDIARMVRSPAIEATARDNLSDVLTSIAAMVGVLGSNYVSPLLDPLAGVLVSAWIFRAAYAVLSENLGYLTGRAAPPEVIEQIIRKAKEVEGVEDVHQVITDYVGPQLRVDMHLDVNGELPFHRVHEISDAVTANIESLDQVDLVYIHVEPAPR
jgi:cation diffusion facilitator family transporter